MAELDVVVDGHLEPTPELVDVVKRMIAHARARDSRPQEERPDERAA